MPAKPKFDPRKLMELAITVMKDTEHEPRHDGKAVPLVGAVVYKADGTTETAYRGELRNGDHAEYTLLERKNRDNRLDNSILFTTLEPCAPGARHEPKISCAERIFHARIKEVWVGIEDPDPTVDHSGIKYLEENGIVVHMFERDLQEIIRNENKEFIAQAEQRALEAKKGKTRKLISLSKLETVVESVNLEDLSDEALELYRHNANIDDEIHSFSFRRRLARLGFLIEKEGTFRPTGFGILVFGSEPRNVYTRAGLLGTIQYPDGEIETEDFNFPLVLIPGKVKEWLENKLPNVIDRSHMIRQKRPAIPNEVVREAVVNALVHRDYDIDGAKCQILVTEYAILIQSPGSPPYPITLEQMQSFNAPMLSRNPRLHYVFAQMNLAEERGLGLKTFKSTAEKLRLPLPRYSFNDPYLDLTFYRSVEGATLSLSSAVLESLNRDERAGLQFLATQTVTTKAEYASHMNLLPHTAQRHLSKFVEKGLVIRLGSARNTKYQVQLP
ncbi:MAG: ATP-binding protein [Methanoregula sp.]|nr:ATP-binding protein [Methanoregula sp.]